jgi:hypothetical protein
MKRAASIVDSSFQGHACPAALRSPRVNFGWWLLLILGRRTLTSQTTQAFIPSLYLEFILLITNERSSVPQFPLSCNITHKFSAVLDYFYLLRWWKKHFSVLIYILIYIMDAASLCLIYSRRPLMLSCVLSCSWEPSFSSTKMLK